jgi:sarcosine oxidase
VVVAVGFSGHGFKMASSLGAVAADLIAEGTTTTDISFMDPARFLAPQHRGAQHVDDAATYSELL